jgi:hypothetical protein
MADDIAPVIEAPKATIFIERKVSVRQYESLSASMHFPVDLPLRAVYPDGIEGTGEYLKELDQRVKDAFVTVKCHIFDQLGLEYEANGSGVIVEKVTAQFGGAAEVVPAAPRPAAQRATAAPVAAPPQSGVGHPDFGTCGKCGGTEWWDNREKKASGQYKPNAADAKCKNKECGSGKWLKPRGA